MVDCEHITRTPRVTDSARTFAARIGRNCAKVEMGFSEMESSASVCLWAVFGRLFRIRLVGRKPVPVATRSCARCRIEGSSLHDLGGCMPMLPLCDSVCNQKT